MCCGSYGANFCTVIYRGIIYRGANVLADALNEGLRSRVTISSDRTPLLDEEEQTAFTDDEDRGEDPSLPFGGKVYLARRKKPDTWLTFFLEVCGQISNTY